MLAGPRGWHETAVVTATHPVAPDVLYRHANQGDLEAQHRVFCLSEGALLKRHRFAWTDPPFEAFTPGLEHLLAHDGDRCFVAESNGIVVGFSAAFVRDDFWFLAMLFIEPDYQGHGIGRRLFELAHRDASARQATITDSIQPVSNALYGKHGLLPTTPILRFNGRAMISAPPELRASDGTLGDLAALDHAAYGFDRAVDHEFWASQGARTVWSKGRQPVAYSYAFPSGRIGPIAGLDEAAVAEALRAELERHPEPWIEIPGSARTAVDVALAAGLRIEPPPGMLLLSPGVDAPRALIISRYMLY
jgi:GNAT superfamily N-acetyltransferase